MSAREPVTWPDQVREAVAQAVHEHDASMSMSGVEWPTWGELNEDSRLAYDTIVDAVLAALAPHVEARVRQAKAEALREAADAMHEAAVTRDRAALGGEDA